MAWKLILPVLLVIVLEASAGQSHEGNSFTYSSSSSSSEDEGLSSEEVQKMMKKLKGVFGHLKKTGFFDQLEQSLGSGSQISGMSKQLTSQIQKIMSQGGFGDELSDTIGSVLTNAGKGGKSGQLANKLTTTITMFMSQGGSMGDQFSDTIGGFLDDAGEGGKSSKMLNKLTSTLKKFMSMAEMGSDSGSSSSYSYDASYSSGSGRGRRRPFIMRRILDADGNDVQVQNRMNDETMTGSEDVDSDVQTDVQTETRKDDDDSGY